MESGKRPAIVVVSAIAIILAGAFALKYWSRLFTATPAEQAQEQAPAKPLTTEDKQNLLRSLQQSSLSAQGQASTSAALSTTSKQQILEQTHAQGQASTPQPSTDEKMKLLQSLQH